MIYRYIPHSHRIFFLILLYLCHVSANESCLNVSSDCCWRENNSSRPWKYHDHIDPLYYRRTFRLGALRAAPARGYYSSVLSDPHEFSALESCDYCSRTGVLKISIRHWASPVSFLQLCFRQITPERRTSQCKELDSNTHGLVETQTIRVKQGYPVNIIIVLRSRSVHLPPTGLIDFLEVKTDPCDINVKPLKKDVKTRFYEHEDGRDEVQLPSRQKQVGRIPALNRPIDNADLYQELLSKKRSYYDKLLEKQLMRKEFKSHQLAAPRVAVGDKVNATSRLVTTNLTSNVNPTPSQRNPKRILTAGWSKRKNDEGFRRSVEKPENVVVNNDDADMSTTTTVKTSHFPDPLSEMFGKDFAEFLEPTFNSSKYEKDEGPDDSTTTTRSFMPKVDFPMTTFPPRVFTTTFPTTTTTIFSPQNKLVVPTSPVQVNETTTENPVTLARLRIQPLAGKEMGFSEDVGESAADLANSINPLKVVPTELHPHLPSFSHHLVDVIPPHIHPAHLAVSVTTSTSRPWFSTTTTSTGVPWTTTTSWPSSRAIFTTTITPVVTTNRPFIQETPAAPIAPLFWTTTEVPVEHVQMGEVVLPEFKEKFCDTSGGCLFENSLCSYRNMNPAVFRQVTVGASNFLETRLNPGQVASLETPTNATDMFFVVFDYLEWTEGERFMGCCQFKANGKSQLRCPFESERTQGEILWRGGIMQCVEGTEKIIFICENLGSKHGICALDNVRLHPSWDLDLTEPCQRDALNSM